MRMWASDTPLMCRNHLVAEHRELHMIHGTLQSPAVPSTNYVNGLIRRGLLDHTIIVQRHDELVREMHARGYGHRTPMVEPVVAFDIIVEPHICRGLSIHELWRRCRNCRDRIPTDLMRSLLRQYSCYDDERCLDRMVRDFEARPTDIATGFAVAPYS